MKVIICLVFFACIGSVLLQGLPIYATWYCSLTDPTKYGYCGNPSAGWVADCGISVQNPPCSGCGIAAFNPRFYNQNVNSHTCQWKGSACGQCWRVEGPSGTAVVMITDCCAGYPNSCSCLSCPSNGGCDWCEKGDNMHFDVDATTFTRLCGDIGKGFCKLNTATQISCP